MEKNTMYAALAALVGLVWMFRKGNATTATVPGFVSGTSTPATTAATGTNPVIIVTKPTAATADSKASNPVSTASKYPAGSNADGTGWAPGDGGPGATPEGNSQRILGDIYSNARSAGQYITPPTPGGAAYLWDIIKAPEQVAKYDAIKDFATQAYDGSPASLTAIAAKARETGTSLDDIGIALGMPGSNVKGYFDRAGVAL
jgi:hypothetical protein